MKGVFGFLVCVSLAVLFAGGASAAADKPVRFDGRVCVVLARYVPQPDTDYQPGVDVNGQPVAPADLPESAGFAVPDTLEMPLVVELDKRFAALADKKLTLDLSLGKIKVSNGEILRDGQPLSAGDELQLVDLCRQAKPIER